MKNRVPFLIGLLIFFISCFVVLILVSNAQTDVSELSTAQEMIKKAFPNSKITWLKEIEGEMVTYRATATALAISTVFDKKLSIKFINFMDNNDWSIDCKYNLCRYFDVLSADEPKLLLKGISQNRALTSLYNGSGELLFKVLADSWVSHSPNLKYFHTLDNSDYHNLLEVYDSEGKFLWKRGTPHGRIWFAKALSDSELIYLDSDECVLLYAFTGEVIWKIPSSSFDHIIHGFPEISPTSNGEYFSIVDFNGIVSINKKGEILWMKNIPMTVLTNSVSKDGKFIALYIKKPGKNGIKKLELLSNFNEGEILWSESIDTNTEDIPSSIHGLKIDGSIISLVPGYPFYCDRGIGSTMHTIYFYIDSEKGTLLDHRVVEGVAETFQYGGEILSYILIDKNTHKEIFRIKQDKIK